MPSAGASRGESSERCKSVLCETFACWAARAVERCERPRAHDRGCDRAGGPDADRDDERSRGLLDAHNHFWHAADTGAAGWDIHDLVFGAGATSGNTPFSAIRDDASTCRSRYP